MNNDEKITGISLIADFDGDAETIFNISLKSDVLPILPLRNMVLFPGIVLPVTIERQFSLDVIQRAMETNGYIGVTYQRNSKTNEPKLKDLYEVGTVGKVMRVIELPNGYYTALIQGYCRFGLNDLFKRGGIYKAHTYPIYEEKMPVNDKEFAVQTDAIREMTVKLMQMDDNIGDESSFAIKNISNPIFLINFVCANLSISTKDKMDLLCISDPKARALRLLSLLNREFQFASLKANIQKKTREDLDQQQREYFLQQQLRNIQEELGDTQTNDVQELRDKLKALEMPEPTRQTLEKEIAKLEHINQQSPDYQVQLNYLQTVTSIPWGKYSEDNIDILKAESTLNSDHYGIDKVKERILEHLAVIKKRGDFKSPIICLYGPPGIGKTSLGRSIAKAMGRKYVRVSLGGVHDEAEIRGHRRTYIGAMPGRIIKGLIKCGTANPVFVLDEIDKVTQQTINGDPSSALLEVLDPEQNSTFHDNFVDLDFDLSKVMFIATANSIGTIPAPLRDRMEMIEMSGYITEEKIEIAKRHLIPKAKEEAGLQDEKEIKFSKPALEEIIEHYTRESGVRTLEKKISEVLRKIDYQYAREGVFSTTKINIADIKSFLGKPIFSRDIYQGNRYAGVVTGLAWTSVGGEILFVETSVSKGKGNKLTLTGNLGDVMKESATLAVEYTKAHAEQLGIDYRIFDNYNIHIHVPEGATPKDGPSAGITIATSIVSALTQRKVRDKVAMTGEITLRGKVLPVGGIKEKILAAKRAGIDTIIICQDNRKDIEDIPQMYLKGVKFEYVENVSDVLKIALLKDKVENAVEFTIDNNKQNDL
ncbi:MAG: endopeptidase La [Prevotellaceae bacterium]|nr:endopeptidase La [Prevotellaceae bacterium]